MGVASPRTTWSPSGKLRCRRHAFYGGGVLARDRAGPPLGKGKRYSRANRCCKLLFEVDRAVAGDVDDDAEVVPTTNAQGGVAPGWSLVHGIDLSDGALYGDISHFGRWRIDHRGVSSTTITSQPKPSHKNKSLRTASLTPAEARVLTLLPTYRTLSAIGNQLDIGRPTVKTHVQNIYKKPGASDRADAVNRAESAGLLPRL